MWTKLSSHRCYGRIEIGEYDWIGGNRPWSHHNLWFVPRICRTVLPEKFNFSMPKQKIYQMTEYRTLHWNRTEKVAEYDWIGDNSPWSHYNLWFVPRVCRTVLWEKFNLPKQKICYLNDALIFQWKRDFKLCWKKS